MAISFALDERAEAFRAKVALVLADALPPGIRVQVADERVDLARADQATWQSILDSYGWGGMGLSRAHGGPGWTDEEHFVFLRELGRADAPRPPLYSLKMMAPALTCFGTAEQVAKYLPDIIAGRTFWCLAFSEPNAGSDLAAMRCSAIKTETGYEITGSKIWTSDAHHADLMCGFFRTSSSGRKQEGITALVVDMNSPGITIRPLPNYEGTHECNEVFFDKVRVDCANLIGEEGNGWAIVKYLLNVERFDLAEVPRSIATVARIRERILALQRKTTCTEKGGELQARLARLEIDLRALAATECRYALGTSPQESNGAEPSVLKWVGTELQQDLLELLMDAYGEQAQARLPAEVALPGSICPVQGGFAGRAFHRYRATTIYGGSTEIQKELIARTALGLGA
ncbi:acyl-CoA dehydrogenase family protein [Mesorhizobium sp. M1312]|uniref:acyl-CoA dehydrogenase family protein n=1 Tax=unclassified Mesorhizobium TaxID=325217 RepID=UPI00333B2EC9